MRFFLSVAAAGALFVPAIASAQTLGAQLGGEISGSVRPPTVTIGGMKSRNLDGTIQSDMPDRTAMPVRARAYDGKRRMKRAAHRATGSRSR